MSATDPMIISCPKCLKRYTVPDTAVGLTGRKVRCVHCAHVWFQTPVVEDDGGDPLATLLVQDPLSERREPDFTADTSFSVTRTPTIAKKPAAPARKTWRRPPALGGWIALAVVVLAVMAGGYFARDMVVARWPASGLFYEMVGLSVDIPGLGLQLQNVHSEQSLDNGVPVLTVEGQIVNVSEAERAVPTLRAVTLGFDHKPVRKWRITPEPARLAPGEIATFRAVQKDPGPVAEVTVTLDGG